LIGQNVSHYKIVEKLGEGGIRTPLLTAGPGVKGGRQVDAFAYVWDVMPTILEYAGIPHAESYRGRDVERMRGRSLTGLITGSTEAVYSETNLVSGEMQNGKMQAAWESVRQGCRRSLVQVDTGQEINGT